MARQTSLRMPRGRPREFDTDAVIERAMGVFWSSGYYGTSLPDLLEATNLSRGSLYAAFGDKHGLFLRALDRYIAEALARLDAELDPGKNALAGLRACLAGYVERTSGVVGMLAGWFGLAFLVIALAGGAERAAISAMYYESDGSKRGGSEDQTWTRSRIAGAMRFGTVLDNGDAPSLSELGDGCHLGGPAVEMHRDDRLGSGSAGLFITERVDAAADGRPQPCEESGAE
jgi:AcrR family transcriptional regulator